MAARKIQIDETSLLRANIMKLTKDATDSYLHCVKNVKNKKAVHNYRLAVKKLACVREMDKMLELAIFDKKVFKDYKQLFKCYGKLRDWNLFEERYKKFGEKKLSLPFLVYIHKKEQEAIGIIEKTLFKTSNLHLKILLNKGVVATLDYKPFLDYYLQRMQQTIQVLVDANEKHKQWHPLRKLLKRCIYLAELLGKEPHKSFVELQNLLGKWHDAHVQLLVVERYLAKHKEPSVIVFKKELKKRRRKFTVQVEELLTTLT